MHVCAVAAVLGGGLLLGRGNREVLLRALDGRAGEIDALETTPYVEVHEDTAVDNIRWAVWNAMDREMFLEFQSDHHLDSSAGGGASKCLQRLCLCGITL